MGAGKDRGKLEEGVDKGRETIRPSRGNVERLGGRLSWRCKGEGSRLLELGGDLVDGIGVVVGI